MHKQKEAEREPRAMRLLATGEFKAVEQQKLATIQRVFTLPHFSPGLVTHGEPASKSIQ